MPNSESNDKPTYTPCPQWLADAMVNGVPVKALVKQFPPDAWRKATILGFSMYGTRPFIANIGDFSYAIPLPPPWTPKEGDRVVWWIRGLLDGDIPRNMSIVVKDEVMDYDAIDYALVTSLDDLGHDVGWFKENRPNTAVATRGGIEG